MRLRADYFFCFSWGVTCFTVGEIEWCDFTCVVLLLWFYTIFFGWELRIYEGFVCFLLISFFSLTFLLLADNILGCELLSYSVSITSCFFFGADWFYFILCYSFSIWSRWAYSANLFLSICSNNSRYLASSSSNFL